MRRKNETTLGDAIKAYLKAMGLDRKLKEHQLMNSWEDTLGKAVAAGTEKMYINNRVLFVQLNSSIIRQELQMMKTALIARLNQNVGEDLISDIVLR
jgi:predicted nucleic acid-binding Zn ribbon protein